MKKLELIYYNLLKNSYLFLNKKIPNMKQKSYWVYKNKRTDISRRNKINYEQIWNTITEGLSFKGKYCYDYGCGNGFWVKKIKERNAVAVIGIDYIRDDAEIKEDVMRFKANRKADIINCVRVLCHLNHLQQERILELIKVNLKPNGCFIVVEQSIAVNPMQFGRNWKATLEYHNFKVLSYCTNGVIEGIVAKSKDKVRR